MNVMMVEYDDLIKTDKKVLLIHGDLEAEEKKKNIDILTSKKLRSYDFVLCTSVVEAGLNIIENYEIIQMRSRLDLRISVFLIHRHFF